MRIGTAAIACGWVCVASISVAQAETISGETVGGEGRSYTGTVEITGEGAARIARATLTLTGVGARTLEASLRPTQTPTGWVVREDPPRLGAAQRIDDPLAKGEQGPRFRLVPQGADAPVEAPQTGIRLERVGTWKQTAGGIARPSPTNTIRFRATLAKGQTGKIRFVLSGVSQERGTCLNAGDGTERDLSFEAQAGFTATGEGKQAIVEAQADDGVATVTVTAHDYAPRGTITAQLEGSQTRSNALSVITDALPEGGNGIEDAWDRAFPGPTQSLAATDDDDGTPRAGRNGEPGDSLSRYEEYRGVVVGGKWIATDPSKLDVFVCDADGLGQLGDFTDATTGLAVHVVQAGEFERYTHRGATLTRINRNRGHASAGVQGVIRVTRDDQLRQCGLSTYESAHADVFRLRAPASNTKTSVNVGWFGRSIATGAAVDATTRVISVGANRNRGDASLSWQPGGKIKLGTEVLTITAFNAATPRAIDLARATGATADALLVRLTRGKSWSRAGWGLLGTEAVRWSGLSIMEEQTTLSAAIDATATRVSVRDASDIYYGGSAYAILGDEVVRVVRVDGRGNTLRLERGALGTTAAAHAAGATLDQPTVLVGVERGLAGSTAAAHGAGDALQTHQGFLVAGRPQGAAHARGTPIDYFFSAEQRAAAVRSTLAHECGHSLNFGHNDRDPSIMRSTVAAGAVDGTGLDHVFDAFNRRANLNVKNGR